MIKHCEKISKHSHYGTFKFNLPAGKGYYSQHGFWLLIICFDDFKPLVCTLLHTTGRKKITFHTRAFSLFFVFSVDFKLRGEEVHGCSLCLWMGRVCSCILPVGASITREPSYHWSTRTGKIWGNSGETGHYLAAGALDCEREYDTKHRRRVTRHRVRLVKTDRWTLTLCL